MFHIEAEQDINSKFEKQEFHHRISQTAQVEKSFHLSNEHLMILFIKLILKRQESGLNICKYQNRSFSPLNFSRY